SVMGMIRRMGIWPEVLVASARLMNRTFGSPTEAFRYPRSVMYFIKRATSSWNRSRVKTFRRPNLLRHMLAPTRPTWLLNSALEKTLLPSKTTSSITRVGPWLVWVGGTGGWPCTGADGLL